MIKIDFEEPDTLEWKEWISKCNQKAKKCIDEFNNAEPIKFDEKLYKEQKDKIYINNESPFFGKCAYCEQKIYSDQHGDIEHFRPKGRITDRFNKPLKIIINGAEMEHRGYYWLAYDWNNLLPSCELCNRTSNSRSDGRLIGKRDQFPVMDFRALHPGEESKEKPLLINPVWENPEDHIEVDGTGILSAKGGSERGMTCIDILGLNDRDLPNSRKKKYDDVRMKMGLLALFLTKDPNSGDSIQSLKRILEIKKGGEEFTLTARKAIVDSLKNLSPLNKLLN